MIPHKLRMPRHEKIIIERPDDTAHAHNTVEEGEGSKQQRMAAFRPSVPLE